jgi:hypothetical protein
MRRAVRFVIWIMGWASLEYGKLEHKILARLVVAQVQKGA